MTAAIPDPRGIPQTLGGVSYASHLSFDVLHLDDYRTIASIPRFSGTAVQGNVENDFEQLALYVRDSPFYWSIKVETLSSIFTWLTSGLLSQNANNTWRTLQKVWPLKLAGP